MHLAELDMAFMIGIQSSPVPRKPCRKRRTLFCMNPKNEVCKCSCTHPSCLHACTDTQAAILSNKYDSVLFWKYGVQKM